VDGRGRRSAADGLSAPGGGIARQGRRCKAEWRRSTAGGFVDAGSKSDSVIRDLSATASSGAVRGGTVRSNGSNSGQHRWVPR